MLCNIISQKSDIRTTVQGLPDHLHEIAAVNNSATIKYCRLDSCEPLGKVIKTSKATQEISEILAPLENECSQFHFSQCNS